MADPRTDRIAAEAARLLNCGDVDGITDAIRAAADSLRLTKAQLPTPGRVRRHAQAHAMQSLGVEGYARSIRAIFGLAEEVMAGLEDALGNAVTMLVGRAARGEVDGDAQLHIRVYTDRSLADLAAAVVALGSDEPAFETVNSRVGRLNRLRFVEGNVEIVITRLEPGQRRRAAIDLFTGRPIESLTLDELRARLDGAAPTDGPPAEP